MSDPPIGSDAWRAQDKGPSVIATCWSVIALSTVFVAARLYVRGVMLKRLHGDDYFSLVALICGYISIALSTVAVVSFGNGKHTALLSTEQQERVILWTTIAFIPGILTFCLPKLAVVVLLIRILHPGPFHKCFLWTMVILCQLSFIGAIGILLGRCRPARSLWDFSVQGTCLDPSIPVNYGLAVTAYSAFVDFYLAVYPSVILFRIQMSLRRELAPAVPSGISATWKKVALGVALGIGASSGIIAIYKATKMALLGSSDFSYDSADLVIWTVVEGSTILIATSIPILRPLVQVALRRGSKALSSVRSSKQDTKQNSTFPSNSDTNNSSLGRPQFARLHQLHREGQAVRQDAPKNAHERILEGQPSVYEERGFKRSIKARHQLDLAAGAGSNTTSRPGQDDVSPKQGGSTTAHLSPAWAHRHQGTDDDLDTSPEEL